VAAVKDIHSIVATIRRRQNQQEPLLRAMREVRDRYNADWIVPLPGQEAMPDLTPPLIADAIDSYGDRAGEVFPILASPALDPTKALGVKSREYASVRRRTLYAMHHKVGGAMIMRRAFKQLAGYATTSLVVMPDFKGQCPMLKIRDPLATFPPARGPADYSPLENVAFTWVHTTEDLLNRFPQLG
jgi:hypothetical protein